MSSLKWFGLGSLVVIAIMVALGLLAKINPPKQKAETKPQVTENFVNPAKIAAITKFRSCQGHVVVPQDGLEPRSNMKHYFYLKKAFTGERRQVELYAPFDGYVSDIYQGDADFSDRNPASRDMTISKKKGITSRNGWGFTFLHIEPRDGLKEGQAVKAGELVGYVSLELIPPYYAFDVAYAKMGTFPKKVDNWTSPYAELDSVFNNTSEAVVLQYQTLGATSAQDFVIDKPTRQTDPCQYGQDGRSFDHKRDASWHNDWIGNPEEAI